MFALENGRLKVLETGTYAFRIQVSFTAATASADNEFFCTLKYYTGSGSFVIQQNNFNSIGSGSKTVQMALTTVVNANAGELYELWVACRNTSATLDSSATISQNRMQIYRIS